MINLNEVVLRVAQKGATLSVYIDQFGEFILRMERGNLRLDSRISVFELRTEYVRQSRYFDDFVDNMLFKLDEATAEQFQPQEEVVTYERNRQ